MKMKFIFASMLAVAALTSCSNDDEVVDGGGSQGAVGTSYIALSVQTPTGMTRANESKPGNANESAIKTAKAVFLDASNKIVDIHDFTNLASGTTTAAFTVQGSPEKLLFVANPIIALTGKLTLGSTFNLSEGLVTTASALSSAANGFVMTNEDKLVDITTYDAPGKAEATPSVVKLDRLVAKVEVKKADAVTVPTGAAFDFTGWVLSITNKNTLPFSERLAYSATTTAVKGAYRKDLNNWANEAISSGFISTNFNVVTDVNNTSSEWVTEAADKAAYCLENTMDSVAQQKGVTTKVVIKAVYKPTNINAKGDSYFKYGGGFYTYENLKKVYDDYVAAAKDMGQIAPETAGGIWKDADAFVKAIDSKVSGFGDAAIDAAWFNGKGVGVTAKGVDGGMRYYEGGVCYYEAFIMHDNGVPVANPMRLGRWGVVRNNWYELTINSVNGPGTPWIPDPTNPDPTDPSQPTDPDDQKNEYIAITVSVNPWTFWQQGVDL